MVLDPEHHRAFLSCEGNDLMTVFDLDKHQAIAFLPHRKEGDRPQDRGSRPAFHH